MYQSVNDLVKSLILLDIFAYRIPLLFMPSIIYCSLSNFDCVNDNNNVHNGYDEYYTGEQGVSSVDFSSETTLLLSCSLSSLP